MPSENRIKLALLLALAVALIAYHAIEILSPTSGTKSLLTLIKVAQITSTSVLFLAFLYWGPIVQLLLGESYIGGIWKGSSELEVSADAFEYSAKEEFDISQSLFHTVITGRSYDDNGSVKSIWTARLYRVEGLRYWFAMELNTSDAEVGVLQFSKHKEQIDGFYHPGNPNDPRIFRFTASRVNA